MPLAGNCAELSGRLAGWGAVPPGTRPTRACSRLERAAAEGAAVEEAGPLPSLPGCPSRPGREGAPARAAGRAPRAEGGAPEASSRSLV